MIDKAKQELILNDLTTVSYDKLLIATGGSARRLTNSGSDLKNVHVLRTAQDQLTIKEAAQSAKNIVVVGGGFVGNEAVASL